MREELPKLIEERLASPKLTPMMRQYLSVKLEHPNALVFFRMGDFFETFYEDAEECAQRLDITLTARTKEKDVLMAGVPHHAVEGYLARLAAQRCTVVIVDQVEDPKQAKGLVRREITRIVTPGTFLDPTASGGERNYLVSLYLGPKRRSPKWALASLDLATGEFRATSGVGVELLLDELSRLAPREILLTDKESEDPAVETIRSTYPDILLTILDERDHGDDASLSALETVIGSSEVQAIQSLLPRPALLAAGRTIAYVRATQLRVIEGVEAEPSSLNHILSLQPYTAGDALILDREARVHLELFVSASGGLRGSLIGAIDRTVTAMGKRLLSDWVAYPSRYLSVVRGRHQAVEVLKDNAAALERIRACLELVADTERLIGRVVMRRAVPRDLAQLASSLRGVPEVLEAVRHVSHGSSSSDKTTLSERLAELAMVDACTGLSAELSATLLDEPAQSPSAGDVFRTGYDEELDRCTEVASKGKELIEALEHREKSATKIPTLKVKYNKVFGYYIEVTKTHLSLVPSRYIRKQTTTNAERYFTDELKELEDEVLHAEERRVSRTESLLRTLLEYIESHTAALKTLAAALAEIDVLAGMAFLAGKRNWVRPEMHEGSDIDIKDGRHPVLEQLVSDLGEPFIANDVQLSREQRLMIITGPNMAGKSTIMRQTALIVILAHVGSFVPARSACIGRVDRVFTRVGASDDLSRGRSTFMVEMTETSRILRSATEHDLVVLDEIGRGTSTYDGLAIAWAVAEHLHDVVQARSMFATHYHELTEICRDKSCATNQHVAVREHKDGIVFLRKLQPGATDRSYGVQVATLAGLPSKVVRRAQDLLGSLEARKYNAVPDGLEQSSRRSRRPHKDQLPLFQGAGLSKSKSDEPNVWGDLVSRIRGLDVDELTPRQALELLAELQGMVREKA